MMEKARRVQAVMKLRPPRGVMGPKYDRNAEPRELLLEKGESVRLRFRLAVYSGKVDKARLDRDFLAYAR